MSIRPRRSARPLRWAVLACALLAALLVAMPTPAGVAPTIASSTFFGGPGDQSGTGIAISGSDLFAVGRAGTNVALIVKYGAPPLTPDWSDAIAGGTGAGGTAFFGVTPAEGGAYAAGEFIPPACGASDGVGGTENKSGVARYTSAGSRLFCRSPNFFAYRGGEGFRSVTTTVEGGQTFVYATGLGEPCSFAQFILGKFDASGNFVARATETGFEPNFINFCAVQPPFGSFGIGDGIVSLGNFLYIAGFSVGLAGEDSRHRPVLLKYDQSLNRVWKRRPTDVEGQLRGITAFGGALYTVGVAAGAGADFLIQKWDQDGNRLWSRISGGPGTDVLTGVVGVGSGLFAVGYTDSSGAGGLDIAVLEIDPATGDTLSTTLFGGPLDDKTPDEGQSAATDGTDLYVVGESRSFAEGGNAVGQNDLVILRYTLAPADTVAPDPPSGLASNPASPANNNNPSISGSAEAGSTVRLYTNATCTGAVAATGSAEAFASGLTVTVADDTTTTFHATATDAAGNVSGCSTSSVTYVEDSTPPTVTVTRSPEPNANGWNNTDVTATWIASDALSGIDGAATAEHVFAEEGAGQSATRSFRDRAGNEASATVSGVNIDKTAPTIAFGALDPAPNANGWNRTDVSIPYAAEDNLSGVAAAAPASPLLFTEEGRGQRRDVTVTDLAGNSTTAASPAVNIDKTAPTITGSRSPEPNANGWNNTDVTVFFSCADALSGIDACGPTPQVVSTEGALQSRSGEALDSAGNRASATIGFISIDKTPPTIVESVSPAPNVRGWHRPPVTVSFECADALSGLASCPPAVTLTTPGVQRVTGSALDLADNVAILTLEVKVARIVTIDVKPGSDPNSFGCTATRGEVPVAILSGADFDATTTDADSVRFGKTGGEAAEVHVDRDGKAKRHVEDVNKDGRLDLVFHFLLDETGFSCADIPAGQKDVTLTARLTGFAAGIGIDGEDALRLVGA